MLCIVAIIGLWCIHKSFIYGCMQMPGKLLNFEKFVCAYRGFYYLSLCFVKLSECLSKALAFWCSRVCSHAFVLVLSMWLC